MSRFLSLPLQLRNAQELAAALLELGLQPQLAGGQPLSTDSAQLSATGLVMLEGSLECAGEPVHLRFEAGTLDSVEDFGFRMDAGGPVLVCGEYDVKALERELLAPIRAQVAAQRLRASGLRPTVETEADGTVRLIVEED